MQKQLNNFSREQANLRFKSFQISPFPLQKKEKIAIVRIRYLFFPWKIYLKIQFPIIEGKANNSTIIKYKLRDKWIVERVGKWTSHENLVGISASSTRSAVSIWPYYRKQVEAVINVYAVSYLHDETIFSPHLFSKKLEIMSLRELNEIPFHGTEI